MQLTGMSFFALIVERCSKRAQYARPAQSPRAVWPPWQTNRFSVRVFVFCTFSTLTNVSSYIDEAQDNLLIDALGGIVTNRRQALCSLFISVIRKICSNPDSGLFWAGDTAQTIAMGSAFRFDDLKSFLYRVEVRRYRPSESIDPGAHVRNCSEYWYVSGTESHPAEGFPACV